MSKGSQPEVLETSEDQQPGIQMTGQKATYNLLRKLGWTTISGNPGSAEQPILKNFPKNFEYALGLWEASAVAMADEFSEATKRPVLVSLQSSAGTGNGMCKVMTADESKTRSSSWQVTRPGDNPCRC
jgi:benzoylformate decarboxylase